MNKKETQQLAHFLFEMGMLAKTPRSGFQFLGSGEQSVAEHINRVCYIGFILAHMAKADVYKVTTMCLFHDITETRISDLNYVHQKYNERKEHKALNDIALSIPFGEEIRTIVNQYEERATVEAKLAKDADNLELLLSLKEQADIGNKRALTWITPLMKRFLTDEGKKLADEILTTDSDGWWYSTKNDTWWTNRNKVAKK